MIRTNTSFGEIM